MKKLQIPIEDELMKEVKKIAVDNDTTLRVIVTTLLEELVKKVKSQ
jgi:3-methyladenine DNA glycosylase AlkD